MSASDPCQGEMCSGCRHCFLPPIDAWDDQEFLPVPEMGAPYTTKPDMVGVTTGRVQTGYVNLSNEPKLKPYTIGADVFLFPMTAENGWVASKDKHGNPQWSKVVVAPESKPAPQEICKYAHGVDTGIVCDQWMVDFDGPEAVKSYVLLRKQHEANLKAAIMTFKRTVREWPTCQYGGTPEPTANNGKLEFICLLCGPKAANG